MKLLVTGGAGFIGSAFVRLALGRWPEMMVIVLDKLTYAGNIANLNGVRDNPQLQFIQGDIADPRDVAQAMEGATHVVNLAAETHVDRSILDAAPFVRTHIEGTRVLLEAARAAGVERFLQVSTDEVYGPIDGPGRADESAPLRPRSPYAATKAGGDLLVSAYGTTYGLPVLITRGSNTYGPRQYPEKLIPLHITNALDGESLPVYGDGQQMRDWIHVDDHAAAILAVLERGQPGETYNIAAERERPNLEVVEEIVALTGTDPSLIRHVADRPGHDRRYALDAAKLRDLRWKRDVSFEEGLRDTVGWYAENRSWWEPLKDADYKEYYRRQYGDSSGNRGTAR